MAKRKSNKRELILQLAMEMFDKSDYESVHMNKIAKSLGVSNGIIYYHFPTKQTLFYEMMNIYYIQAINDYLNDLEKYDLTTIIEFKKFFLKNTQDMFEKNYSLLRLIKIENMTIDKGIDFSKIKTSREEIIRAHDKYVDKIVEKFQVFSKDEIMEIFYSRASICLGYYFLYMEPKSGDNSNDQEKILQRKQIFQKKALQTFADYLDGVLQKRNVDKLT